MARQTRSWYREIVKVKMIEVKTQACDILQITLKMLRITHAKVAHTKVHGPCASVSGHFAHAHDFRDAQLSTRASGLQVDIGIVALQQPEWHIARLTGDTQERFPTFKLARHHFANPVPTQESFFQTAMVLQTPLRKLRRRDLGKIQADCRAQRRSLALGETVQGEQTLDGHIEPFSILTKLLLRCHANRIAFDVEPIIRLCRCWDRSYFCQNCTMHRQRCGAFDRSHDRHNHTFLRCFLSTDHRLGSRREPQRLSSFDTRTLTQTIHRRQGSHRCLMALSNGEERIARAHPIYLVTRWRRRRRRGRGYCRADTGQVRVSIGGCSAGSSHGGWQHGWGRLAPVQGAPEGLDAAPLHRGRHYDWGRSRHWRGEPLV